MKSKSIKAAGGCRAGGERRDGEWASGRNGEGTPAGDGFLNKEAVALRLGVRPRTVGVWARQGKFPAYRVGPYLRFKWAEVERALAATCRVNGERKKDEL